jgi:hypothetical protein
MANEEHLAQLKQGVEAWNQWRAVNHDIRVDLTGADLRGANLRIANRGPLWRTSHRGRPL